MSIVYKSKIEALARSIFYIDSNISDSLMKLAGAEPEISEEQAEALVDFLANNERLKGFGLHDNTYIVGGAIRDALLGLKPKDIDLVIDTVAVDENPPVGVRRGRVQTMGSDGSSVAVPTPWTLLLGRAIGEELGIPTSSIIEDGKLVVHVGPLSQDYFWNPLTHKVDMEHGVDLIGAKIEIVSARSETYDKNKGQPEVIPSSLEEDLKRRDFGINAMALSLSNASDGLSKDKIIDKIVDATGSGPGELKKRLRDVYRPGKGKMSPRKSCLLKTPLDPYKTFEDDPSRILRAIRFALKYGCEIEEETRNAMSEQAHFLKEYSWNNINKILITKILFEPYGKKALQMMKSLGVIDVLADMFKTIKGMKRDFNTRLDNHNKPHDHPIFLDLVSMGIEDLRLPAASKGITQQHRRKMKRILEQDPDSDVVSRAARLSIRLDQVAKEVGKDKFSVIREKARDFIIDNPEKSNEEVLEMLREHFLSTEASYLQNIKTASMGPENVHIIANKLGIDWDNNDDFMQFTKDLTGKGHLDDMDRAELRKVVDSLKKGAYSFFEISKEVSSLNLSGDIYVFDFDDTLMWAPEWHSEVDTDEGGYVINPGGSTSVKNALDFINNFKDNIKEDYTGDVPSEIKLKKISVNLPELGKDNQTIFQLVDESGAELSILKIKEMFSSRYLKSGNIDTRGRYSIFPAVTVDNQYYTSTDTLGTLGANEELFNIYNKNIDNAIVLTARSSVPGMKDGILKKIKDNGSKEPLAVFTKPIRGPGGGPYKGMVLSMIASIPSVNSVIFFDDNQKYINAVEDSRAKLPDDIAKKIKLNIVSTINKPACKGPLSMKKTGIFEGLIHLANYLDIHGLKKEADVIDAIVKKSQSTSNKAILGVVGGILGRAKSLSASGNLVNPPPSREDLIQEGMEYGSAHLRRWFQIMIGEEVRGPDFNRKKQALESINKAIIDVGLHQYGFSLMDIGDIDDASLEDFDRIKKRVDDVAAKVKAMNSKSSIGISVSKSNVMNAIKDWSPPDEFTMLKNDSFHVTIISPQTVSNFKSIMSKSKYESLMDSIVKIPVPDVVLSGNVGLAVRPSKKTYAIAIENQKDFENYRDLIIDEVSESLRPSGSRVNPMNWWFERHSADRDRFFHVSIANDDDGWPTSSVADVNQKDFIG